jgi:hypothetical protein
MFSEIRMLNLDDSVQNPDDRPHVLYSVVMDKGDTDNSISRVHPKMSDQTVSIEMAIANSDLNDPVRGSELPR